MWNREAVLSLEILRHTHIFLFFCHYTPPRLFPMVQNVSKLQLRHIQLRHAHFVTKLHKVYQSHHADFRWRQEYF